jgi:hypothetical protein
VLGNIAFANFIKTSHAPGGKEWAARKLGAPAVGVAQWPEWMCLIGFNVSS